MRKVLTIFLDGLRFDSLQYMPFVNSFKHKARLKTQLGYSVTCHGSMYTGVYPDKHGLFFIWKKSLQTSPFKIVNCFKKMRIFDFLPFKLILHKFVSLINKGNTSFFGIPRIVHLPIRYWCNLDVAEKKLWNEDGYIGKYLTIFEILRKNRVKHDVVGMDKSAKEESQIIARYRFHDISAWTYLFMGDVDHFSHRVGQHSPAGIKKLKELDELIRSKYTEYSNCCREDFDFILFSDHGHIPVEKKVDVYQVLKKRGIDLNCYFHITDVNFLRIWVEREDDKKMFENVLVKEFSGMIMTDGLLKKYRLPINREENGNIIFYLDTPYVFSKTIWGYSQKLNSMHGYLPEHSQSDGVFLSNRKIEKEEVSLVDILPSHLSLLKVEIPNCIEGESVWGENE